jgi:hypothetical protein
VTVPLATVTAAPERGPAHQEAMAATKGTNMMATKTKLIGSRH